MDTKQTVVIPHRKGSKLERSLDSVDQESEVIVVHYGRKDDPQWEEIRRTHPNVRFYRMRAGRGYQKAATYGSRYASGTFVRWLPSGDALPN